MRDKLKRAMPWLLTLVIIVTLVVVQFTVITAKTDGITREFLSDLAINVILISAMSTIWMAGGQSDAENKESSDYAVSLEAYREIATRINAGHRATAFEEFCRKKTEEARKWNEDLLLSAACIDREKFEAELRGKSKKELKALGYSTNRIRAIRKVADGRVKVWNINPLEITTDCGTQTKDPNGVHRNERAVRAMRTALKVLQAVVSGVVLVVLVFQIKDDVFSIAAWAMFAMKLTLILVNAWSGYTAGVKFIEVDKRKVLINRITFMHKFFDDIDRAGE